MISAARRGVTAAEQHDVGCYSRRRVVHGPRYPDRCNISSGHELLPAAELCHGPRRSLMRVSPSVPPAAVLAGLMCTGAIFRGGSRQRLGDSRPGEIMLQQTFGGAVPGPDGVGAALVYSVGDGRAPPGDVPGRGAVNIRASIAAHPWCAGAGGHPATGPSTMSTRCSRCPVSVTTRTAVACSAYGRAHVDTNVRRVIAHGARTGVELATHKRDPTTLTCWR